MVTYTYCVPAAKPPREQSLYRCLAGQAQDPSPGKHATLISSQVCFRENYLIPNQTLLSNSLIIEKSCLKKYIKTELNKPCLIFLLLYQ
jgi:hypothetical protein